MPNGTAPGPLTLDLHRHRASRAGQEIKLTSLEAKFLTYLDARRGRVVPTAELLREVWGYHPGVQSKAPQLLVSRLRRKLGDDADAPRLILTLAEGYGLAASLDVGDLVARTTRLRAALRRDGRALAALEGLLPEIDAAL